MNGHRSAERRWPNCCSNSVMPLPLLSLASSFFVCGLAYISGCYVYWVSFFLFSHSFTNVCCWLTTCWSTNVNTKLYIPKSICSSLLFSLFTIQLWLSVETHVQLNIILRWVIYYLHAYREQRGSSTVARSNVCNFLTDSTAAAGVHE